MDLIFSDDGSLVIVDYKTDAIPVGALSSWVTYYGQMEAYARCLAAAADSRVSAELMFLHPAKAGTGVSVV